MARLSFVLAVLALLCAGTLAAVVVAPDRLPPRLSALTPTAQAMAQVDRLSAELKALRQEQAKAASDLGEQQQQSTDRLNALQEQVRRLETQLQRETTGSIRTGPQPARPAGPQAARRRPRR